MNKIIEIKYNTNDVVAIDTSRIVRLNFIDRGDNPKMKDSIEIHFIGSSYFKLSGSMVNEIYEDIIRAMRTSGEFGR